MSVFLANPNNDAIMRRKFSVFVLLILVVQASTTFVCDDGNFLDNSWLNDGKHDEVTSCESVDVQTTAIVPTELMNQVISYSNLFIIVQIHSNFGLSQWPF